MSKRILVALLSVLMALPIFVIAARAENQPEAWLGVYTQTIDRDLKEAFDLDSDNGVVVKIVVPKSPADKAGIKQGDIILKFDNDQLTDADQLIAFMQGHKPGDKVNLDISHKGNVRVVAVELGTREDNRADAEKYFLKNLNLPPKSLSKTFRFDKSTVSDTYIGVSLESLNYQLGEFFGIKDGAGALITEVMEDSPASKAGLKAGDVVTAVDGASIKGPSDVTEAVGGKKEGDRIDLTILRNKAEQSFAITVEKAPDDYRAFGNMPWLPGTGENFMFLPRMKGLYQGDFDSDLPDMSEMQNQMQNMQEQMQKLQEQLKNLQEQHK